MIALVAADFFDALAVAPHRLDLLGRFDQRLDGGRRVAIVGVLHGHTVDP